MSDKNRLPVKGDNNQWVIGNAVVTTKKVLAAELVAILVLAFFSFQVALGYTLFSAGFYLVRWLYRSSQVPPSEPPKDDE